VYLLFPTEDGIKTLGIGERGSRLLLMDLFVVSLVIASISIYGLACRNIMQITGKVPWFLFLGAFLVSLIRGLPAYGGMALGEARWFACALLVPVGFALATGPFIRKIEQVFLFAAALQAIGAVYEIATAQSWDETESVMRFSGGRQALAITFGVLVIVHRWFDANRPRALRDRLLLIFFLGTILAVQTRSLFLFLPLIVLFYVTMRLGLRMELVKRLGKAFVILGGVLLFVYAYVLPRDLQTSINASAQVVVEGVSPTTLQYILDPYQSGGSIADQFSKAGNTAFRVMAWSQVLQAIDESPGGWFIGMPMGSGFFFADPSGQTYENLEPHNDYLSILSKIGLIGLYGYFVLLFRACLPLARREFGDMNLMPKTNALFLMSLVLLLSLYGSLNAEMRTYGTHFWLWPLLGMSLRELSEARWSKSHSNGALNCSSPIQSESAHS
jgi:O-antigen ligase